MARSSAFVTTARWTQLEWKTLTQDEQWLYLRLYTAPDIGHHGVLPLTPQRWAASSRDGDVARIEATLLGLANAGWVLADRETQEVCLRTFVKDDRVDQRPNVVKAAQGQYLAVHSERIRELLFRENPHVFGKSEGFPEGFEERFPEQFPGSPEVEEEVEVTGGGARPSGEELGSAHARSNGRDEELIAELEQDGSQTAQMLASTARRYSSEGTEP